MKDKPRSLEWQLGYYVGEHIIAHDLPTLSVDGWLSRKVVQVSPEDAEGLERIQKTLRQGKDDRTIQDENWKAYLAYRDMLEDKYLPQVLECYVPQIVVENKEELINGIEAALWNCDMSHYWCPPDVVIENDEFFWLTRILLPLYKEKDGKGTPDNDTVHE